jgi:hypothetical protein
MKQTRIALMAAALVGSLSAMAGFAPNQSFDGARSTNDARSNAKMGNKSPAQQRAMAAIFGGMGSSRGGRRNPGPGWSNAHVKRMARKARNVKANRANHK